MATLYLEAYDPERGGWIVAGTLRPGERPGSLSDNTPEGRVTYTYALAADGRHATIGHTAVGLLYRDGSVATFADVVRTLGPGEEHEMEITSDVGRKRQRVRFRLEGDGDG